jgi:hypothetical protein
MTGDANLDVGGQDASPSWTPWSAAYAYAEVMRAISIAHHKPQGAQAEFWDVPTMLIAYGLASYADQQGIAVTRPADLAELSGMELWNRLATPPLVASLATLSPGNPAVTPAAGEPAHELFVRMKAKIDDVTAGGPTDARERAAKARRGERAWYERGEDAQALVALTLLTCVDPDDRAAGRTPLRVITDRAEGSAPAVQADQTPFPAARPYELSEYMAAETPWPERNTPKWAARVMNGAVSGRIFLLLYLSSIDDQHLDVPGRLVAPRKAGESEESHAQRVRLAKLLTEAHVLAADWSPDVATELLHIRPSDAVHAVDAITRVAREWWTAAEYDATITELVPAMTPLLDGLVTPERRGDVQKMLGVLAVDDIPLARVRLRLTGAASDHPFEALHLAAAFTAALYQVPACVPDQREEYHRLVQSTADLAEGKVERPRAASPTPPEPASAARKADPRKKASRKASRKTRRQGRR